MLTKTDKLSIIAVIIGFMVLILLLTGCGAGSKVTYTADGNLGYSINCSGAAKSWEMCWQQAGKLCGTRGYEVVAEMEDAGYGTNNGFGVPLVNRGMIVECH